MAQYFETHFHLDYLKKNTPDEILSMAREVGVDKFITIAVEPDNLQTVLDISAQYEDVWCTQGVHPHDARLVDQEVLATIKKNAIENEKVVAIGEIGLDYHYDNSPRDIQRDYFKQQLELAIELDMPVVIHTREAEKDTIAILDEFAPRMNKKGVLHSFTSKPELAEKALEHGFHLGFNGIITFKKAEEVREIVKIVPIEKILIETDAPFLTPAPHRGKENAPRYLPHIAEKIAEIKELEIEQVLPVVYQNSCELFFNR
jgi:TatD DNase family protein